MKEEAFDLSCLKASDFPYGERGGSERTNDQRVIEQIKRWIYDCTANHTNCGETRDACFKPTRLLDVGNATTNQRVRLVISAQHFRDHSHPSHHQVDPESGYITLSHRWGQLEMLKLLKNNETSFRDSIPFENLPRTFQHAIEMTRQLGVRYLWIDALCIVQDSRDDWLAEGAAMADVYKNAFCNLSASSAMDSTGGIFFRRHSNCVTTSLIRPRWLEAHQKNFIISPHFGEATVQDLEASPLQRRGWVLQERLLSPRIVHFTATRVFFECHMHIACELFPLGIFDPHAKFCTGCEITSHYSIHRKIQPLELSKIGEQKEIIEWNRLVERYTQCELTYGNDKLIALSGIATHFSRVKVRGIRYLAGIWESQLPYALLWRPRGLVDVFFEKQREYRAPSWSWASVDGAITMGFTEHNGDQILAELAEVYESEVLTTAVSPTGATTGGFIRLFCVAAIAHVGRGGEIFRVSRMMDPRKRVDHSWRPFYPHDTIEAPKAMVWYDLSMDLDTKANQLVPFILVKYYDGESGVMITNTKVMGTGAMGLALRQLLDGTYERIGVVEFRNRFAVQELLEYLRYPEGRWITLV